MRIRLLSDLHLECYAKPEAVGIHDDVDCDVVILAGDVDNGVTGIEWAARTFGKPVIYVLGNHEYYQQDATELLPRARECAAALGVHLLEKDEIRIAGVRFLGCTLWTGFDAGPLGWIHATRIAHPVIADFSEIRNGGRQVSPSQMVEWHEYSLAWLRSQLRDDDPAVVITHFAPTLAVVNPKFGAGDELTPYFHCSLEHLMGEVAALWIYGHNHYSADMMIETDSGSTRVVSNQLGYPDEAARFRRNHTVTTLSP